jgi:hypothetical protein
MRIDSRRDRQVREPRVSDSPSTKKYIYLSMQKKHSGLCGTV